MKNLLFGVLVSLLIVNCATVIQGTTDEVSVLSSEKNTKIYINGKKELTGQLANVELERGEYHMLVGKKEGCSDKVILTDYEFDTVTLLDILFIYWIVPLPYDLISGNAWEIEHNSYDVTPECS